MRTNSISFLLLAGFLFLASMYARASDEETTLQTSKCMLFYTESALINQWSLGTNPASLQLYNIHGISRVHSEFGMSEQHIKRAFDPGKTIAIKAFTQNMQTLGKAKVSGMFGYQNQHYRDLLYNGNMDFSHTNIYMLGDSIGGNQRQEGYFFNVAVSYPLFNKRLLAGLGADYESTLGAKMRDIRNLNTISKFRLLPGFIYQHNNILLGISGGPIWENNVTQVTAVLDEKHSLFYHMGMGHFSASRQFSQSESVRYETDGFQAELQLQYKGSTWSLFQQFNFHSVETQAFVGSTFRLINGITDVNRLSYTGHLLFEKERRSHQFMLDFSKTRLIGTEVRQETRSINQQGVWISYIHTLRWIDDKHITDNIAGELSYTYSAKGEKRPFRYQLTLAANAQMYEAGHYPVQNYGYYESTTAGARLEYRHYFQWNRINIDPLLGGAARFGLSEDINVILYDNLITSIPHTDHRFFKEDYVLGTLGVSLSTSRLPLPGISQTYLNINSTYAVFPNIELDDNFNFSLLFSLGVIF